MAKRRPKGDGMIRKRKDTGRWEGRIVVGHKVLGHSQGGGRGNDQLCRLHWQGRHA